ncbi:centaurin ADOP ribosylation factor GTPase activating protein family [Schizosaccharomyces cryophilus OY26]|uniref:ADP-ribosylation factor GTPase-activating protein n=1 Tax=Schizosaccharomyces cryophilus (strain OY26 / ATCC MYA-4695 / CBS 11777 / NBRC 106824 / NRRL Y48691) TaxID=653667 RepID=S9W202_SCHCR|nr:centaurin ADOP ribosylation factor GTPase activating protein family [Schizosaccharomyces cryophilus OY26]EPY52060.1 centaurin ADOP ribosylation factor GTPase activating protein family [Schizosaccharomyces cryophilus OY26]
MNGNDTYLLSLEISNTTDGSILSLIPGNNGMLTPVSNTKRRLLDMTYDTLTKLVLLKLECQTIPSFRLFFTPEVANIKQENKKLFLLNCESIASLNSFFTRVISYDELCSQQNVYEVSTLVETKNDDYGFSYDWKPSVHKTLEDGCFNYSCLAIYSFETECLVSTNKLFYYIKFDSSDFEDTPMLLNSPTKVSPKTTENCLSQSPKPSPEPAIYSSKTAIYPETYEDNPFFRSILHELEQKSSSMKLYFKKIMKRIMQVSSAFEESEYAFKRLSDTLYEASTDTTIASQPMLDEFLLRSFELEMIVLRHMKADFMNHMYGPLQRIYSTSIKPIDDKKLEFEEQSKSYYTLLSRFMSCRKDSKLSESVFFEKEKRFALQRYDYYCFMQDLYNGSTMSEISEVFLKFVNRRFDKLSDYMASLEYLLPQLQQLMSKLEASKWDLTFQEKCRRKQRSAMITKKDRPKSMFAIPSSPLSDVSERSDYTMYSPPHSSSSEDFQKVSSPTSNVHNPGLIYKEGLLFVFTASELGADLAVRSKAAWHKYWVAIKDGYMLEYANWKDSEKISVYSISLRNASVRKLRKQPRKYCLELISPKTKRLYQTTSETELDAWISSINDSIKSLTKQSSLEDSLTSSDEQPVIKGVSSPPVERARLTRKISGSGIRRAFTRKGSWNFPQLFRSASTNTKTIEDLEKCHASASIFIEMLRRIDPENSLCADCGSTKDVTWCSINIPVILCIECSGVHRSLGCHISKTRSLLFDSFPQQLKLLLSRVGNSVVNRVFEARINSFSGKPFPDSDTGMKAVFAKKKYAEHAFMDLSSVDAYQYLIEGLRMNETEKVLLALAAQPNFKEHRSEFLKEVTQDASRLHYLELMLLNGLLLPSSEEISKYACKEMEALLQQKHYVKYREEEV